LNHVDTIPFSFYYSSMYSALGYSGNAESIAELLQIFNNLGLLGVFNKRSPLFPACRKEFRWKNK